METFAQIHEQDRTLFAIYTGSKLKKDEQDMLIGMGIFEYTIHIKLLIKLLVNYTPELYYSYILLFMKALEFLF